MGEEIHFDEEQESRRPDQVDEKPYFVRLVLSTGVVSTDQQANYVLLGIVVAAILLASFFFHSANRVSKPPPPMSHPLTQNI